MLYIKRPKPKESQETIIKREKGYLTEKELTKYLEVIEDKIEINNDIWSRRDRAIIYTLLTTGMRNTALRMLDVSDVDLNKKILTVTDKGGKVITYDMSQKLCLAIDSWLLFRNEFVMYEPKDQNCKALFVSQQKKRMSSVTLKNIVKKYAVDINGKNITPHKLRATYGTQLYNKTGDIYFVQQCMGHTNPKTTELYVRERKQNTKRASDIMDKLI